MSVKEASAAQTGKRPQAPARAEDVAEAAHLAGSTLVTGAVATVLAVIALPVSAGLAAAWGVRALARRLRRD